MSYQPLSAPLELQLLQLHSEVRKLQMEIEDYYLKIGKLKDEIMLKNQEIMKFTQDNP